MASTSTNKQPLLIDRVFHEVYEMSTRTILTEKVTGTNFAQLILNCTTNDGAIIEDIYTISQGGSYQINLYLSSEFDFLRDSAVYVGQITTAGNMNEWVHMEDMPYVLAPTPQVGTDQRLKAFYVPKGKALWAARKTSNLADNISDAPLLGISGGFY
tara:strand:+ start:328 stop:798 length:471 start_codon:yes stop_codon:yes gene_type:complete